MFLIAGAECTQTHHLVTWVIVASEEGDRWQFGLHHRQRIRYPQWSQTIVRGVWLFMQCTVEMTDLFPVAWPLRVDNFCRQHTHYMSIYWHLWSITMNLQLFSLSCFERVEAARMTQNELLYNVILAIVPSCTHTWWSWSTQRWSQSVSSIDLSAFKQRIRTKLM